MAQRGGASYLSHHIGADREYQDPHVIYLYAPRSRFPAGRQRLIIREIQAAFVRALFILEGADAGQPVSSGKSEFLPPKEKAQRSEYRAIDGIFRQQDDWAQRSGGVIAPYSHNQSVVILQTYLFRLRNSDIAYTPYRNKRSQIIYRDDR